MAIVKKLVRALRGGADIQPVHAAPYAEVELFSWAPADGRRNFGDHLSKVIAYAVALENGLSFEDEVSRPRRMLAIGSIAHFANNDDVLWGTGVNGKIDFENITASRLDVRAVRGPKTAGVLQNRGISVPRIFGDPGLLVPRYFASRFPVTKTRPFIIVPNLHDLPLVSGRPETVSPLKGWNRVVREITSAEFVVSSSLHGIVIAEAFGIPARYVRLSETEDRFKYDDYALGTGRAELLPASTIDQALDMGPHDKINFDADALVAAFPIDLWT
jgi:pyruvyltransferase